MFFLQCTDTKVKHILSFSFLRHNSFLGSVDVHYSIFVVQSVNHSLHSLFHVSYHCLQIFISLLSIYYRYLCSADSLCSTVHILHITFNGQKFVDTWRSHNNLLAKSIADCIETVLLCTKPGPGRHGLTRPQPY